MNNEFEKYNEPAQKPKPSELLRDYEQMTHAHKYSYVMGENTVLNQVDKGNQEMIGFIAPQLGRELFKLVELFDSMGMGIEDVISAVDKDDAKRQAKQ